MDSSLINQIWEKAKTVESFDASMIRKDCCGAWILKSEFGNRNSKFGWEIDHVYPVSKGGDDTVMNLRPMQWENNNSKGEDFPVYNVVVRANGNDNVRNSTQFKVNENLIAKLHTIYNFQL